jgi:hypothetical protein
MPLMYARYTGGGEVCDETALCLRHMTRENVERFAVGNPYLEPPTTEFRKVPKLDAKVLTCRACKEMEVIEMCACGHSKRAHDFDRSGECFFAYNCDCDTYVPRD